MNTEIPLIPANKNKNFHFNKNNYYWGIDVLFDHTENINLENLFLIFKSYITNKEILLKSIYIIGENSIETVYNKKITIFHHISTNKLQKMSYIDFCE
jgi:hypothetical protein